MIRAISKSWPATHNRRRVHVHEYGNNLHSNIPDPHVIEYDGVVHRDLTCDWYNAVESAKVSNFAGQ
jgi:hypothetical protein